MLSKNKIFLRLLGSFYDQVANTEFANKLDTIYTNILFNRYVDIFYAKLSLVDDSLTNIPMFGHVLTDEVDVSQKKIQIRDIHKNLIDPNGYVSFGYIDIEKFYKISNGVVSQEVIDFISNYGGSSNPIIYIKDVGVIFENGETNFLENISEEDNNYLTKASFRILANKSAYFPSTTKIIEEMVNIVCGALYASMEEEVLYVDDEMVITTKNEYLLEGINAGKQCVVVGDKLNGGDLITKIIQTSGNNTILREVEKINSFMATVGLSTSNKDFLSNLSRNITKSKTNISIDMDLFTSLSTDTITLIAEVAQLSSNKAVSTTSSKIMESSIGLSSSEDYIFERSDFISPIISEGWILDIFAPTQEIFLAAGEKIIYPDADSANGSDNFAISMPPVIDSSIIEVDDVVANILEIEATSYGQENIQEHAKLIDTNIATPKERGGFVAGSTSSGAVTDGSTTIEKATASFKSSIPVSTSGYSYMDAKRVDEIIIDSIIDTVYKNIAVVEGVYKLGGDTFASDTSAIKVIDNDAILLNKMVSAEASVLGSLEKTLIAKKVEEIVLNGERKYSGNLSMSSEIIQTAEAKKVLSAVKSMVIISDTSDVSGENIIDE